MILDCATGKITDRPFRLSKVGCLVVRDNLGTPVAVFRQMTKDAMTYVAAGDPKFKEELASAGFLDRVDVLVTSL